MVTGKAKKKVENVNIELLELAVSCRLITLAQEQQILTKIFALSRKDTKVSAVRYLLQNKILEKDQIEFLYAVKKHLDTLMLDKKFGNLGVANDFVSRENVSKALDIQVKIFRERGKSIKIGDILLNNNEITEANKTAILLTQDRIRDEFLADALNAIATNEMERSALNKRFGAIAVKKKLISKDQLNTALKQQKKETEEQGKHRYLGQILKEVYDLSDQQILMILRIQKKLETRRMNLQKKVFTISAETESIRVLDRFLELKVSEDKLAAYIAFKKKHMPRIDTGDLLNWLSSVGIKYGICTGEKIRSYFTQPFSWEPFEIAVGKAPVQAKKETVGFMLDIRSASDKDPVQDIMVRKDDVLASVIPFRKGVPGRDVFGHPIAVEQVETVALKSGQGVTRKGNDFIALLEGVPRLYKNRTLFVLPNQSGKVTKQINGDLTGEPAKQYAGCNLVVTGNITEGTHLDCHNLVVKGNVMGTVKATGDVDIEGNIGDADSRPDPQPVARVRTQGRLMVGGKTICARIIADKGLVAPRTDVVNSRIFSSGDVVANNILSSEKTPTAVRIAGKNLVELQKLEDRIHREQKMLDDLTHQPELDDLHVKLMKQVQVQNGYLEKQNVLVYLVKLFEDTTLEADTLEKKRQIQEARNKKLSEKHRLDTIPENTKAYVFLKKICDKISSMTPADQKKYVIELAEHIIGLYKAAVKVTDRVSKQYEVLSSDIETLLENHKQEIDIRVKKMNELLSRRDFLLVESKKAGSGDPLLVKVKNEVGQHTVIKGVTGKMVVDKAMYGVFVREKAAAASSQGEAQMIVDGYFE